MRAADAGRLARTEPIRSPDGTAFSFEALDKRDCKSFISLVYRRGMNRHPASVIFNTRNHTMSELYTFVAGGALEADATFNVKCNCGGDAPITPRSTAGYGFSKKGPEVKVVDKIETRCPRCGTKITATVLEGDPGYVLTSREGIEALFLPQGSTSKPVSELSEVERRAIIAEMKRRIPD